MGGLQFTTLMKTLKDLDILHTIKGSGFYVKTMIDLTSIKLLLTYIRLALMQLLKQEELIITVLI